MSRPRAQRGQALVMVTLGLLVMFGIIGLAVDLGWAFYVKRSAQAAADAAALAAVREAMGMGVNPVCGNPNVVCQVTPQPCPSPIVDDDENNLDNGCLYAQQNGFVQGGNQTVTMQSNTTSPPPTAPGVVCRYWVTVRISERIPQLFSAVLGYTSGISSARATAAIAEVVDDSSLVLLNRESDPNYDAGPIAAPPNGTDLLIGGGAEVTVPGGIRLASTAGGPDIFAGDFGGRGGGEGAVHTPQTLIQGDAGFGGLPDYARSRWDNWFVNRPDSAMFRDPFEGKGQPPLANRDLPLQPLLNGTLACTDGICPEGVYFATRLHPDGLRQIATGDPIIIPKGQTFQFRGGAFGEFVFFGGLQRDAGGGGNPVVDFGPGRYVMAGVKAANDGEVAVLDTGNKTKFTGGGVDAITDAGRIFILTDSTYPGLKRHVDKLGADLRFVREWDQLRFGYSNFQSGNNDASSITLQGIDKFSSIVPEETNGLGYTLKDIGNVVIWQDQRNSNVRYQMVGDPPETNGHYDISCGDIEDPCRVDPPRDRHMELSSGQDTHLEGVVYQPRGATVNLQAAPGYVGPIKLVAGSLRIWGTARLTLNGPLLPTTTIVSALVE